VLYTAATAARWTAEGLERPDEGRRHFALSVAVLVADLALMLLPPAVGVLVLVGLVR
jgi:hypothetical protein